LPHLDLDLQARAFAEIGERGAIHLRDAADADALVQGLCEQLGLARPFPVSPRTLRSTVHEDTRGPRVVFVLNQGDSAEHAELSLPSPLALRDAMSGERFEGADSLAMPVPAWGCRMLLVERGPRDQ
jgi:hypothetical protein